VTTGSQNFFFSGLKRGFPAQWGALTTNFLEIPDVLTDDNVLYNAAQNMDALAHGGAYGLNIIYQEIEDVPPQVVLQTATGNNLDLLALDFFGSLIKRSLGQSDASFRQQIEASFFTIGPTMADMYATLSKLYGSGYRILQGIPQLQAWNISNWGYDSPTAVWGSRSQSAQVVIQAPPAPNSAQQTINNAAIALTRPAGVRVWMTTTAYGNPQPSGGAYVPPRIPGKAIGAPYIMSYGSVLYAIIGGVASAPVIIQPSADLAAILGTGVASAPVIIQPSADLAAAIAA
jgi:hypothetical protein